MSSTLRRVSLLAVVGTLILTLGAGPGEFGDRRAGLQVQSVAVQGTAVTVVLANTTAVNLSGTLTIRPLLLLPPISVPVSVAARRTLSVRVTFPGALTGGVTCGVVLDDGAPF